jgi:hypothetical protein
MADTDGIDARAVQLKRAGFVRKGGGWARGSLTISDASLAAMPAAEWAKYVKLWRQQRR